MGVALGYAVLAYQSLMTGLNKLELNAEALADDLDAAWEVLAEPIQTVMRRYGVSAPHESSRKSRAARRSCRRRCTGTDPSLRFLRPRRTGCWP